MSSSRYYQEAEARFGVPWSVLAAVNLVETGFGRIVGLSSAGALGPMQFIPATWDAYGLGGDVWDPHDAILGAANYLAANGGGDGTSEGLDNALIRYNHSQHYVAAVRTYASLMQEDPRVFRASTPGRSCTARPSATSSSPPATSPPTASPSPSTWPRTRSSDRGSAIGQRRLPLRTGGGASARRPSVGRMEAWQTKPKAKKAKPSNSSHRW